MRGRDHADQVEAALGIEAVYLPWHAALTGCRYSKVIWLAWDSESKVEAQQMEMVKREYSPTHIVPGGKVFIL